MPLTFTSTEAHSMFGSGEPLVKQRERQVLNGEDTSTCVYLHGDIERMAGFDIPVLVEGDLDLGYEHLGTPCVVEPFPFGPQSCKLFLWHDGLDLRSLESGKKLRSVHGLIVSVDDEKSLAYARERMAVRAKSL